MRLIDLPDLTGLDYEVIADHSSQIVSFPTLNSRESNAGAVFFAVKGFKTDGHLYLENAYQNGCRDFVIQSTDSLTANVRENSTIIKVADTRTALARYSSILYGSPDQNLYMAGITGTKGKTTVSTLLHRMIGIRHSVSLFSTVENIIAGKKVDTERTTNESYKLYQSLRDSVDAGVTHTVMEVSSHALTLKRVEGILWDMAVFTSFSQDHLDLYGTMDAYFQAKLELFERLNGSPKKNKTAVIHLDDPKGPEVFKTLDSSVKPVTVGYGKTCSFRINRVERDGKWTDIHIDRSGHSLVFKTLLKGDFNVVNVSLAAASALEIGITPDEIQKALDTVSGIEGRFETVIHEPFHVIVDYAHTPDSLQKMLEESRRLTQGRLYCVFGCAGDRDREKRPIMGGIASRLADYTIIANDDTYTEDPQRIADEVTAGFIREGKTNYEVILDRRAALKKAISMLEKGDLLLAAGMGHEKYRITGEGPVPYNERKTIEELLMELHYLK